MNQTFHKLKDTFLSSPWNMTQELKQYPRIINFIIIIIRSKERSLIEPAIN